MRLAAALVAVALVVGAGCSDDGGDGPLDGGSVVPETTVAPSFTGDADSAFCEVTRSFATEPGPDPFAPGLDPVDVQIQMRNAVLRLEQLVDAAPAEIEDDLTVLLGGLLTLENALREYDFDLTLAVASGVDIGDLNTDPAFRDAGTRVSAYQAQVCDL